MSEPHIPADVQASELDRFTLHSLRTLPDGLAEQVGRHLAAAARVLADDPDKALLHARAAARKAGRVAVVREAVGVAAYAAGDFASALTELRAAARISGSPDYLPMMADCERGLGRPERALALATSAESGRLDREGKVELLIVAAGARRDLGQADAAVLTLQVPALRARGAAPWLARLRYAYADALLDVGRVDEAREWFGRAAEVDPDGETDAVERLDALDGIAFEQVADLEGDLEPPVGGTGPADVARLAEVASPIEVAGSEEEGGPADDIEPGDEVKQVGEVNRGDEAGEPVQEPRRKPAESPTGAEPQP